MLTLSPSRRAAGPLYLVPLLLALSVANAYGASPVTGAPGVAGRHGTAAGESGAAGGIGQDAIATALNDALATGGVGGAGGNGAAGNAGQNGGAAGAGGVGGNGEATVTGRTPDIPYQTIARSRGGQGGAAGVPGSGGAGASSGLGAVGGRGGDGKATNIGTVTGNAQVVNSAAAGGGAGGDAYGLGGRGGTGGTAQARAETYSDAGYIYASTSIGGGRGGNGYAGAAGGNGGDVTNIDSVRGGTRGHLELWQDATGGDGGSSVGGNGGNGGNAATRLTYTNDTTPLVDPWMSALGGEGGSSIGGQAGAAGSAEARLVLDSTLAGAHPSADVTATAGRVARNDMGVYGSTANALASATVRSAGVAGSYVKAYGGYFDGRDAQTGNVDAYSRTEARDGSYSQAVARTGTDATGPAANTVAKARAEAVSTSGLSSAVATSQGIEAHAAAHSWSSGSAGSNARADAEGQRGTIVASSTATNGTLVATTGASSAVGRTLIVAQTAANASGSTLAPIPLDREEMLVLSTATAALGGLPGTNAAPGTVFSAAGTMGSHQGGRSPGSLDYQMSANFQFDTAADSKLWLTLSSHPGYAREIEITITDNGVALLHQVLLGSTQAASFFQDNVLSLGDLSAGSHDLLMLVEFTGTNDFMFQYTLASVVPEPQAWLLTILGIAVVFGAARRKVVRPMAS